MLAALGLAGAGTVLERWQPYLMTLSVSALAFGFYRLYRQRACQKRSRATVAVLWSSAVLTLAFLLFPQAVASLLADLLPA